MSLFCRIKGVFFGVFLENYKTDLRQILFQCLGENTHSLQSALKGSAPGLEAS